MTVTPPTPCCSTKGQNVCTAYCRVFGVLLLFIVFHLSLGIALMRTDVLLEQGEARAPPKEGFAMGSRTWGVQEIFKIYRMSSPPTSLNRGMGCMEQGHGELVGIATVLQITSRTVFNISITFNWFHGYVKQLWPCFEPGGWE